MSASRSTRSSGGGGSGGARSTKRARTDDQQDANSNQQPQSKRDDDKGSQTKQQQPSLGRPQLLLATDELRKRTGKKYCDESELLPLLLAQGLVRALLGGGGRRW